MLDLLKRNFSQLALAELVVPRLLTNSKRNGLFWARHRLRSAEPREIVSRTREVFRHLALALTCQTVRPVFAENGNSTRFFLKSEILEMVAEEKKDSIKLLADGWLDHRGSFFGLRDASLGDRIDWHRDYSSVLVGPKKYSALINHRKAAKVGDVKYIWELNRLQHLVLLALTSLWAKTGQYDREIHQQMFSWCEQNPFMIGLNWKSPLEAGLRLISWALVSFVSGERDRENRPPSGFLETVYWHQYFVSKFYSKHSSANNHLIGEMAGLYVASVFWPYFRHSNSWRCLARQKLIDEILRQVGDDGVCRELSIEYQLFILEFFILAGALGHAIGDPFPQTYWDRIQRMGLVLSAFSDRNGNLPMLGDGDSGQVISLPQSTRERVRSLLNICQIHRGENPEDADLRSQLLLWGQKPQELALAERADPSTNLKAFSQGGYYVLANNRGAESELIVVFDAGSLGLAPLYAHGHADALSFWLSYGGCEFLIDPGTFTYYGSDVWRDYFRSTAAHNTLRIDGLDQSVSAGRFLWRHVAHSHVEDVEDSDKFVNVTAFHDGYRRLSDPVMHRRSVRLEKSSSELIITDSVECKGSHDVEIFFHFSEQCEVRQDAPNSFTALSGDRRLRIRLDPGCQYSLLRGSESPILGWVSRKFGVKEQSVTLTGRARILGSTRFVSEITPL